MDAANELGYSCTDFESGCSTLKRGRYHQNIGTLDCLEHRLANYLL
jgi:hypothetical protein